MHRNGKEIVLVTGASRGIGRATAQRFARAGYAVVLHYNTGCAEAEQTAQELQRQGALVMTQQADLRDSGQVQRMVQAVEQAWGTVDVLVNNAGIAQQKLFTDLTDADWHNMFGIHVDGTFYCCRAVLPGMIHQKQGCIIKEVGPSGIRVNCVAPGVIQTEMNRMLDEETLEALREETPLEVLGTVEDVASAIYFLATSQASFITGQIIGVNGGMVI